MTAELAVALPAVVLVLVLCVGLLQTITAQAMLADASAQAARQVARGEPMSMLATEASATELRRGDLVCVRMEQTRRIARLPLITIGAEGCALSVP